MSHRAAGERLAQSLELKFSIRKLETGRNVEVSSVSILAYRCCNLAGACQRFSLLPYKCSTENGDKSLQSRKVSLLVDLKSLYSYAWRKDFSQLPVPEFNHFGAVSVGESLTLTIFAGGVFRVRRANCVARAISSSLLLASCLTARCEVPYL